MTFCKYEFLNQKDWDKYQAQITQDGEAVNCAIVEIGQLENGFAVDILWNDEPLDSFATKEVFPSPCGIHTFSGCDEMYTERFCDFNPLSTYCTNEEL
jgi:hypothetical protein